MDAKFINRYNSYCSSLSSLEKALTRIINMRNELSHDYDGSMARDCFDTIVYDYIPLFQQFRAKAGTFMEQI